jgi:hypothetical protein
VKNYLFLSLVALFSATLSAQTTRAKRVFAHYLPWYDTNKSGIVYRGGWCHQGDCTNLTNKSHVYDPLIGEYSQFDPEVLRYHIRLAYAAHIDGFLVNVNPTDMYQWKIFNKLCDEALAWNAQCGGHTFKIIISFDNSAHTNYTDIENDFKAVRDSFYTKPVYSSLVFNDDATLKPLLVVWSEVDVSLYRQAIDAVFGTNQVIYMGRNARKFDEYDANFEWIGTLSDATNRTTNWGKAYLDDFDWGMARQSTLINPPISANLLKMGAVYPGFDDSNVPAFWNGGTARYIARDVLAGETMALTWDNNINYTPLRLGGTYSVANPWVQLCTWNDFPEGTQIEPTALDQQGYRALETTRAKSLIFKGLSTPTDDNIALKIPIEIYNATKQNRASDATQALTEFCNGQYKNALNTALGNCFSLEITGNLAPCGDGIMEYSVPLNVGTTYFWTASGGIIVSGQGTNKVSIKWNGGVAGAVKVSATR